MPSTAAAFDLAYTTALVAASRRMWAASDVAALWRTVVDEAVALIACDGAAVLTYTGRLWQALAARPSDAAPDDSAVAAVIEMLFRRGVFLQQNFDRRLHGRRLVGRAGLACVTGGAY